jgi:peptide/nickel transport system permease protein
MRAYAIRRLLLVIPTVLLVSMMLFMMLRLIPGDIIDLMVSSSEVWGATRPDLPAVREALGLDQPMLVQYGRWMGLIPQPNGNLAGILQGDLGLSLWGRTPVIDDIAARLPISLQLGAMGIIAILLFSLPVGLYAAVRQDSAIDHGGRGLATAFIALPSFWVAIMVVFIGSTWLGKAPPLRYVGLADDPIKSVRQLIVPALIVGMGGMGTTTRLVRSTMLEVLRQDYVRTAWSKGLRERVVIARHAMRNALIPIVTIVGGWIPPLIGGTVVIETVFGIPGMGRLLVNAITDRDYNIVSGVVFVYAIILVVINVLVDLSYGFLDPRVRYR